MDKFNEISYDLHRAGFKSNSEKRKRVENSWFEEDTVDYWRHFRMLTPLSALLNYYNGSKCVTIGDGRFGLDSIRLKKIEHSLDILPTDIATDLLQKAKERGIIGNFRTENAENLSFSDNEFDFSFCIEAYHHFPRPYIALYEMLRISKKGIILIEPNDKIPKALTRILLDTGKQIVKKIAGRKMYHPDLWNFEECGNFIFSLSKREIEKIAIGLQLPMIALYLFNDYYEPGVEFEKAGKNSKLFNKVKSNIKIADIKCKIGLQNYSGIIAMIFKEKLEKELIDKLKKIGFEVVELPKNPYLKDRPFSK